MSNPNFFELNQIQRIEFCKEENDMKEKESGKNQNEPKVYCCFTDNSNQAETMIGLAFKDFVENQIKVKKGM